MAQGETKNIGNIAALWVGASAPDNVKVVWYDTLSNVHRVYSTSTRQWEPLSPQSVTNSTLSDLNAIIQGGGNLPVGQFYYLTDLSVLAIAITISKIWYVDNHLNYVVNDLSSQGGIQSCISTENLLIDGMSGSWDSENGRLRFDFAVKTAVELNKDDDYILVHGERSGVLTRMKFKLAELISGVANNGIEWNNGLYLNFSGYITDSLASDSDNSIASKGFVRGIQTTLAQQIQTIADTSNNNLNTAKTYTNDAVTTAEIYNKEIPVTVVPNVVSENNIVPKPNASVPWNFINIFNDIYGWLKRFKDSKWIKVGYGFNANISEAPGEVNYDDTVRHAFEKVVYKLKHQAVADNVTLPEDYDPSAPEDYPQAGDSISEAIAKLADLVGSHYYSDGIKVKEGDGVVADFGSRADINYSDTIFTAFRKLLYRVTHITSENIAANSVTIDKVASLGVYPAGVLSLQSRLSYRITTYGEITTGVKIMACLCKNEEMFEENNGNVTLKAHNPNNKPIILAMTDFGEVSGSWKYSDRIISTRLSFSPYVMPEDYSNIYLQFIVYFDRDIQLHPEFHIQSAWTLLFNQRRYDGVIGELRDHPLHTINLSELSPIEIIKIYNAEITIESLMHVN